MTALGGLRSHERRINIRRAMRNSGSDSQFPSGAILTAEEFVGVFEVGKLQTGRIPKQLADGQFFAQLKAQGDVAEQHRLGKRPRPIEIRSSGFATFAAFDPFFVMSSRTRDGSGNLARRFGTRLRVKLVAQDEAVFTNKQMAIGAHYYSVRQTVGPRRAQSAIVPNHCARRHLDATGGGAGQLLDVAV